MKRAQWWAAVVAVGQHPGHRQELNALLDEDYDVFGVATHGSALRNLLHLFGVDLGRIANGTVFHLIYEDGCWRPEAFD